MGGEAPHGGREVDSKFREAAAWYGIAGDGPDLHSFVHPRRLTHDLSYIRHFDLHQDMHQCLVKAINEVWEYNATTGFYDSKDDGWVVMCSEMRRKALRMLRRRRVHRKRKKKEEQQHEVIVTAII